MITIFTFILFFLSNLSAQQYYYTFSELRGMEDNSANTHLFYRLYTFEKAPVIGDYFENSIYHFDLGNATDTLFLYEGGRIGDMSVRIVDLEFWNNNPGTYIYLGEGISVDPVAFIRRYDHSQPVYSELGEAYSLELGKQNDSLVFASAPILIKSTDGGFNWSPFTVPLRILSITPYSDDEIFFNSPTAELIKTSDGLQSISTVDTNHHSLELFYDKDSVHIYSLLYNRLKVSDNKGNAFSWTERYTASNPVSSSNRIYLTVDYSQSGKIYVADGKRILVSENYGISFNEFKVLNRDITGIYKKPGTDILYAATKYKLYEIDGNNINVIKSLPVDPGLFDYLLFSIGNKWVYQERIVHYDPFWNTSFNIWSKEIIAKEIKNGKEYFVFRYLNYNPFYHDTSPFERIDSLTGIVYRYSDDSLTHPDNEYEILDLLAEVGDTTVSYFYDYGRTELLSEGEFSKWGITDKFRTFQEFETLSEYHYTFNRQIGLDTIIYGFDFGYSESHLKGAVLNGIIYGDTTLVGVDNEEEIPSEFSLSQNYPNPFNPTTSIEYRVGSREIVTLKVYDVLGREVATLVNEEKQPGVYEVEFNPESGIRNLASGVYYYRLKAGDFVETKKMILLR